jgi:hypothetical protein
MSWGRVERGRKKRMGKQFTAGVMILRRFYDRLMKITST